VANYKGGYSRGNTKANEAYAMIGVLRSAVDKVPRITAHLDHLMEAVKAHCPEGEADRFGPIYLLRCSDAPEARALLDVYDEVPNAVRKRVQIEAFCLVAKVSPLRILEIIAGTAWKLAASTTTMIQAATHPKVVSRSVKVALGDEPSRDGGVMDRRMLHLAAGFLPTPQRSTIVNVRQDNNSNSSAPSVSAAPPPEKTIRTLVDRFNDSRAAMEALPPISETTLPLDEPDEPEYEP